MSKVEIGIKDDRLLRWFNEMHAIFLTVDKRLIKFTRDNDVPLEET